MSGSGVSPMRVTRHVNLGPFELSLTASPDELDRWKRQPGVAGSLRVLRGLLSPGERSVAAEPAPAAWSAAPTLDAPEARSARERVAGMEWYHTLELPHGIVTPGYTDHRASLPLYGLPSDMRGMRVLDVATFDGYWAFEMERRGAQVLAIDIGSWAEFDYPRALRSLAVGADERVTGGGFALAKELLGSHVERQIVSVYQLDPSQVGQFDFVFLSDLLLHLRDPQLALEHVCSVVKPGGTAVIADVFNPALEPYAGVCLTEMIPFRDHMRWLPSTATLKEMLRLAGFASVDETSRFPLRTRQGGIAHKVVLRGSVSSCGVSTAAESTALEATTP